MLQVTGRKHPPSWIQSIPMAKNENFNQVLSLKSETQRHISPESPRLRSVFRYLLVATIIDDVNRKPRIFSVEKGSRDSFAVDRVGEVSDSISA
jgi:hypothetical protein